MAEDATDGRRAAASLLPLGGRPWGVRIAVLTALVLVAGAVGAVSLALQGHYADAAAQGVDLNPVTRVIADGSGPRTAWTGWAAAFLFLLSTLRLLRGRPEPPVGRPAGNDWTVAEMRAALRREFHGVRLALAVVGVLAVVDAGRAAVFGGAALAGSATARSTVGGTLLESAGLVAAALVLAGWTAGFRRQLRGWGAL